MKILLLLLTLAASGAVLAIPCPGGYDSSDEARVQGFRGTFFELVCTQTIDGNTREVAHGLMAEGDYVGGWAGDTPATRHRQVRSGEGAAGWMRFDLRNFSGHYFLEMQQRTKADAEVYDYVVYDDNHKYKSVTGHLTVAGNFHPEFDSVDLACTKLAARPDLLLLRDIERVQKREIQAVTRRVTRNLSVTYQSEDRTYVGHYSGDALELSCTGKDGGVELASGTFAQGAFNWTGWSSSYPSNWDSDRDYKSVGLAGWLKVSEGGTTREYFAEALHNRFDPSADVVEAALFDSFHRFTGIYAFLNLGGTFREARPGEYSFRCTSKVATASADLLGRIIQAQSLSPFQEASVIDEP